MAEEYIRFELTQGVPGAPVAHLQLVIEPGNKVTGKVDITQAVAGPPVPTIEIAGTYFEQQKIGPVVSLLSTGPAMPGRPEFSAVLMIPTWIENGEGWFWYFAGQTAYNSGPVPANYVKAAVAAAR